MASIKTIRQTIYRAIFGCEHPIDSLVVDKEQTVTPIDDMYEEVTYHFRCLDCNVAMSNHKIVHARLTPKAQKQLDSFK